MIKFYSIKKSDLKIRKKIFNSIKKVITNNNFINGSEVKKFEKNFSSYCGSKYAISCSNGTDAITLSLKALNLKRIKASGSSIREAEKNAANIAIKLINDKKNSKT